MTVQQPDENQPPPLASLLFEFLRLGMTAFGGPAMIAFIRTMAVERRKWLDETAFQTGLALCQTLPGATAMQVAAYVGLRTRGIIGAAVTYIAFGFPAFCIMLVLSALYVRTSGIPAVISAFNGLQVIVIALIAFAAISFGRTSISEIKTLLIALIAAALFAMGVHPLIVIAAAALLGYFVLARVPAILSGTQTNRMQQTSRAFLVLLSIVAAGYLFLFLASPPLFQLAGLMSWVDMSAFGGGFSALPLMFHEVVSAHAWIDPRTFLNGIAMGQITPGPIVITATFVGYMLYGPVGGVVSTLGIFIPSFLLVVGTAPWFDRLRSSGSFNAAIRGILCSFVGLLIWVTVLFAKNIPWDIVRVLIFATALIALYKKVEVWWVVLAGAVVAVLVL